MIEKTVKIQNERGIHVRPCCAIAELANGFDSSVTIVHHGDRFNGKTSMSLIAAWIQQGDEITVECNGNDEAEALEAVVNLIESGFAESLKGEM